MSRSIENKKKKRKNRKKPAKSSSTKEVTESRFIDINEETFSRTPGTDKTWTRTIATWTPASTRAENPWQLLAKYFYRREKIDAVGCWTMKWSFVLWTLYVTITANENKYGKYNTLCVHHIPWGYQRDRQISINLPQKFALRQGSKRRFLKRFFQFFPVSSWLFTRICLQHFFFVLASV